MLVPLILNIPEFQSFCFFKKRLVSHADAVLQVIVIAKLKNNVRVANSAKPTPFCLFSGYFSVLSGEVEAL